MTRRKKIRDQRLLVGDAEIELMDTFRDYFTRLVRPLPDDIAEAYEKMEKQNSELRRLEDDHLRVEEDLGASEWKFVELETNFYQYNLSEELSVDSDALRDHDADRLEEMDAKTQMEKLLVPTVSLSPTVRIEYEAIASEHFRLLRRFEAFRKQQSIRMDVFTEHGDITLELAENTQVSVDTTRLVSDLLNWISECDVRLRQLRSKLGPHKAAAPVTRYAASEAGYDPKTWPSDLDMLSRTLSEGGVSMSESAVPFRERVGEWSLELLKSSAMEKLLYLQHLWPRLKSENQQKLDFVVWDRRITELWSSESLSADIAVLNLQVETTMLRSNTNKCSNAQSSVMEPALVHEENHQLPYTAGLAPPEQDNTQLLAVKMIAPPQESDHFINKEHYSRLMAPSSSCGVGDSPRVPWKVSGENMPQELPSVVVGPADRGVLGRSLSIPRDSAQVAYEGIPAFPGPLQGDMVLEEEDNEEPNKGKYVSFFSMILKSAFHKTGNFTWVRRRSIAKSQMGPYDPVHSDNDGPRTHDDLVRENNEENNSWTWVVPFIRAKADRDGKK